MPATTLPTENLAERKFENFNVHVAVEADHLNVDNRLRNIICTCARDLTIETFSCFYRVGI
jgi:hypothetical protein